MVFGLTMGAGEIKSARNERIRIVAFQNINNKKNRASIGGDTAPQKPTDFRKFGTFG